MDAKYIGKTIALPKDVHESLESYRARLSESLGFKASLSDAIAHLLKNSTQL